MKDRIRVRPIAVSLALAGLVALAFAAPASGAGAKPATATGLSSSTTPPPPRLPRNFVARGRWVVEDLGISVPFRWQSRNGNSRMVAGGPNHRIWFVNLIYRNSLYTLTYRWPRVHEHPCVRIPGFNLRILNQSFQDARFVGREILLHERRRRHVNHWRVGAVWPTLPPGNHLRLPLALADIYVDQRHRGTWRQLLLFGLPNLLDPELDEWGVLNTFRHRPGTVRLPPRCSR